MYASSVRGRFGGASENFWPQNCVCDYKIGEPRRERIALETAVWAFCTWENECVLGRMSCMPYHRRVWKLSSHIDLAKNFIFALPNNDVQICAVERGGSYFSTHEI